MSLYANAKAWIKRQVTQRSTIGGTVLSGFALFWPNMSDYVSEYINTYQDVHPTLVLISRLGIASIGLACIIYNEDKNKSI